MNLIQIFKQFPTQNDCTLHLEKTRWNGTPICPYCNSNKSSKAKKTRYYTCLKCNNGFSVTVDTSIKF